MQEVWKNVKGYERYYQVSNLGKVKSLERIIKHWKGGNKTLKERILKPGKSEEGYLLVVLHMNKKGKTKRIHRLVAETFIENQENKPQVNHINGIKDDNRTINLEWVTAKENVNHGYKTGLITNKHSTGENNHMTKFVDQDIRDIRRMYKETNLSHSQIAKIYDVKKSTISHIINKVNWKHVK